MSDDEREHPDPELVTVYETSDPNMAPIIKSMLDGAEIPYSMAGESMVNLLPSEHMVPVMTDHEGELVIQVPKEHEEDAKALLSEDFEAMQQDGSFGEPEDGEGI